MSGVGVNIIVFSGGSSVNGFSNAIWTPEVLSISHRYLEPYGVFSVRKGFALVHWAKFSLVAFGSRCGQSAHCGPLG